ncbi:hypothetical protein MJO28_011385 [Puccinia striiformis f. sp. tritici]|uniref:Uncharacterized protein n=1 Tax=Puccinia striiformis f. sp. tritici TaxID=168172 RepID=A0ACC0E2J4_9BASI|nr:hypothetical protein MJO28_011385 [Puccinia striiformis f. sp. tritici]
MQIGGEESDDDNERNLVKRCDCLRLQINTHDNAQKENDDVCSEKKKKRRWDCNQKMRKFWSMSIDKKEKERV